MKGLQDYYEVYIACVVAIAAAYAAYSHCGIPASTVYYDAVLAHGKR